MSTVTNRFYFSRYRVKTVVAIFTSFDIIKFFSEGIISDISFQIFVYISKNMIYYYW